MVVYNGRENAGEVGTVTFSNETSALAWLNLTLIFSTGRGHLMYNHPHIRRDTLKVH